MRAWKGLKTAMGNVLRVEFKIAVEKSYLIIYTPENDSAREKREKDGRFPANGNKKAGLHASGPKKWCSRGDLNSHGCPLAPQASASANSATRALQINWITEYTLHPMRRKIKHETKKRQKKTKKICFALSVFVFCDTLWLGNAHGSRTHGICACGFRASPRSNKQRVRGR